MENVPSGADNTIQRAAHQTSDASTTLRRYRSTFVAKIEEVEVVYTTILKEKDITPPQCSRAITSLSSIDEPIKDFHILLQNQTHILLPSFITEKRHRLLVILNDIEDRVSEFQSKAQSVNQQASSLIMKFAKGVGAIARNLFRPDIKTQDQHSMLPIPSIVQDVPTLSTTAESSPTAYFNKLYNILQEANELALKEISLNLGIEYNRLPGGSQAEKAFELTKQLQSENRLDELEKELRRLYSRRFEPE